LKTMIANPLDTLQNEVIRVIEQRDDLHGCRPALFEDRRSDCGHGRTPDGGCRLQ